MTFYIGAYDHSVFNTTAQLTEGRSARDQPKQPPAKKKTCTYSDLKITLTEAYLSLPSKVTLR